MRIAYTLCVVRHLVAPQPPPCGTCWALSALPVQSEGLGGAYGCMTWAECCFCGRVGCVASVAHEGCQWLDAARLHSLAGQVAAAASGGEGAHTRPAIQRSELAAQLGALAAVMHFLATVWRGPREEQQGPSAPAALLARLLQPPTSGEPPASWSSGQKRSGRMWTALCVIAIVIS